MDLNITYAMTLGLRFNPADIPRLRDLARKTGDSMFTKAANSAESNTPLVVECMAVDQLQSIMVRFAQGGVEMPTVEELRG